MRHSSKRSRLLQVVSAMNSSYRLQWMMSLPLLIFAFYGMNVDGLPYADSGGRG